MTTGQQHQQQQRKKWKDDDARSKSSASIRTPERYGQCETRAGSHHRVDGEGGGQFGLFIIRK